MTCYTCGSCTCEKCLANDGRCVVRVRAEALREAAKYMRDQEWAYESGESPTQLCRSFAVHFDALADEALSE